MTRLRGSLARKPFPDHVLIRPPTPKPTWVIYFLFTPHGRLSHGQRVALGRIRDMGLPLHVVCAASDPAAVPAELDRYADALHWKGLSGYDVSGYTVGLHDLAVHSPGATVMLLNDSVWGPLVDLRPFIDRAAWDLTGFTAFGNDENHVQSYAWILKQVTPERMRQLAAVLTTRWAHNWPDYVVSRQETVLARHASRSMTVGSFLYWTMNDFNVDPSLTRAFDLVDAGHPFLKKSLLGKFSVFQDVERVASFVVERGFAPATRGPVR